MRVTRVQVDAVAAPFPQPLHFAERPMTTNTAIVVHLEEIGGAVGFGYAPTLGFGTGALHAMIGGDLAPLLIGRDLESVDDGLPLMSAAAGIAGRPGGVATQAMAIIEMALWDLSGQLGGMALHALWGQPTTSLRAYASGGWRYLPADELVRRARGWANGGFEAVKMQVGLSPEADASRLRSVRDAVGPDIEIMLDANQRIPIDVALEWGRALSPFDPTWLEEPIAAEAHSALAALRANSDIPIAAGESETEPIGLDDLLDEGAVDVVQPDVHRVGISAVRAVGTRVAGTATALAPHMAHEVSAQLLSGASDACWLEYFDWFEEWWDAPNVPTGGRIAPATTPGHGLRLRPGWLESHRI